MFVISHTIRKYLYPLLFWTALYLFWLLALGGTTLTFSRHATIQFCYLVFVALNYYITINYLIPKLFRARKYYLFLLAAFLSLAVASLMRAGVAIVVSWYIYHASTGDFSTLYLNSLLNIFIWSESLVAGKFIFDKLLDQRRAIQLEREKIKNELNFLRAQSNPHFLFNSLNSLYFQIDKNNPEARDTLLKLSEILRYQLYECTADKIEIEREIEFLRNYVELQKMRLNNNYHIEFNTSEEVRGFSTAPLLIMPLIENAFKHISHFTDKRNEIIIDVERAGNRLTCIIQNTIEPAPSNGSVAGGIGLKNLERRLELQYPAAHELTVKKEDNYYKASLTLSI